MKIELESNVNECAGECVRGFLCVGKHANFELHLFSYSRHVCIILTLIYSKDHIIYYSHLQITKQTR